jgi:hypothetical protein
MRFATPLVFHSSHRRPPAAREPRAYAAAVRAGVESQIV